jgi:hypothetical protein
LEIGVPFSIPHEMRRTSTLEHDGKEWSCTECSRRLLFRRLPAFKKVVLDRGDEWASHVGGSSGLHVAAADVTPRQTADLRASDRNWLAAQGIAWEPDEITQ